MTSWWKKISLVLLVVLLLNATAPGPINDKMQSMAEDMQQLLPYVFSEKKFLDEKNYQTINNSLSAIVAKLRNIKKHDQVQTLNKQVTLRELQEQMVMALYHFTSQKKVVARMEITSLLNLCIQCHTQTAGSSTSKIFGPLPLQSMELNTFEKAEVYFLTRDYDHALPLLRELVVHPGKDDLDIPYVREKSLNLLLTYQLRLQSDLVGAKQELSQLEKRSGLLPFLKEKIQNWQGEIKKLQELSKKIKTLSTEADKEKFLDKNLSKIDSSENNILFEDRAISALYLSGILNQYLESGVKSPRLLAKIFYWLAVYDKRLNSQLFYSLGDHYLQLCIKKVPHSSTAQQCYEVMEEDTLFHYSGSMGTHVPASVKAELSKWKKLAMPLSIKKK